MKIYLIEEVSMSTMNGSPYYTLGRFLGVAQIMSDPKTWQMTPERAVEMVLEIAREYEAAKREAEEVANAG